MWRALCRYVTYPLWDLKDGRGRLAELRSLRKSQYWSPSELRELQIKRLNHIVAYAFDNCRFYQESWGKKPSIQSFTDLEKLPIVSKRDIATNANGFLSSAYAPTSLIEAKTGGSTGTSLKVYFDETCQKKRNAAAMRTDEWAGWRKGMLIGGLWGTPPIPVTIKEKIRNALHDRIFYLDTMRLDEASMMQFARRMCAEKPGVLFGHAHSIFIFASFLKERRFSVPQLSGVISTSMMLIEKERHAIEEVLNIKVTNRYGCEEVGLIGSECQVHDGLHLNSEHVHVEILREDDSPAADGEEGRIVVTDLVNKGMPLIRYEVGDMGVRTNRACSCGRGLPLLESLTGRRADFLVRRDGSRVAGISLVEKTLTAIPGLAQLQIIQESIDQFVLNVVPSAAYTDNSGDELRGVLYENFGADADLKLNLVERLSQERNSKYRFSICRVK